MFKRYVVALEKIGEDRLLSMPGLKKTLEGCCDLEVAVELLESIVKKLEG